MKKNNNKFKNNNIYNLSYRFDSLSPAGKCCGTALDLIKRYNDLAKEASVAGNYVEMEVFRQYAEHYRKIVTEINERKNIAQTAWQQKNQQETLEEKEETVRQNQTESQPGNASESVVQNEEQPEEVLVQKPLSLKKKSLKIVEVKTSEISKDPTEKKSQTKGRHKEKISAQTDLKPTEDTSAAV